VKSIRKIYRGKEISFIQNDKGFWEYEYSVEPDKRLKGFGHSSFIQGCDYKSLKEAFEDAKVSIDTECEQDL